MQMEEKIRRRRANGKGNELNENRSVCVLVISHKTSREFQPQVETCEKSSILLLRQNRGPAAYKWWDPRFLIFKEPATKHLINAFLKKRRQQRVAKRSHNINGTFKI